MGPILYCRARFCRHFHVRMVFREQPRKIIQAESCEPTLEPNLDFQKYVPFFKTIFSQFRLQIRICQTILNQGHMWNPLYTVYYTHNLTILKPTTFVFLPTNNIAQIHHIMPFSLGLFRALNDTPGEFYEVCGCMEV